MQLVPTMLCAHNMAEYHDYLDMVRRELGEVIRLAWAELQSLGEFLFIASAIECLTTTNNNKHFSQNIT